MRKQRPRHRRRRRGIHSWDGTIDALVHDDVLRCVAQLLLLLLYTVHTSGQRGGLFLSDDALALLRQQRWVELRLHGLVMQILRRGVHETGRTSQRTALRALCTAGGRGQVGCRGRSARWIRCGKETRGRSRTGRRQRASSARTALRAGRGRRGVPRADVGSGRSGERRAVAVRARHRHRSGGLAHLAGKRVAEARWKNGSATRRGRHRGGNGRLRCRRLPL